HQDGLLNSFDFESFENCESCLLGKMTKDPFHGNSVRATNLLILIHNDVSGPLSINARRGFQYFITFTDDFSRYGYVYLMKHIIMNHFKCLKLLRMKYKINLVKMLRHFNLIEVVNT